MGRVLYWILMVAIVGLAACKSDSDDALLVQSQQAGAQQAADQQIKHDYREGSWRDRYLELGRETYSVACASCHDDGKAPEGKSGVPSLGDRESWSSRSPLWSAVLLTHAREGYLDMPASGGHPDLTERAVEAAGEYMLNETFPELPRD